MLRSAAGVWRQEAFVIVCSRCSKENQDHYKFCLGCGAELPRNVGRAEQGKEDTPPSGTPAQGASNRPPGAAGSASNGASGGSQRPGFGGAPVVGSGERASNPAPAGAAAPQPSPAAAPSAPAGPSPSGPPAASVTCPNCKNPVPGNFRFCGTCGHNMQQQAAAQSAPPAAQAPAPAAQSEARGKLVIIRPDGSEGESLPLSDRTVVGRDQGGMFGRDTYLSPHHATFSFKNDGLHIKDEDSLNGVYIRIPREQPVELANGQVFRIGQEIVRFETLPDGKKADGVEIMGSPNPGYLGRICLVVGRDTDSNAYCIPPDGVHLGRERGDVIFPEDGYVSALHCRIHGEGGKVWLTDVGSSNGTFLRIQGEQAVPRGALLLMGQQLFRAEY